MGQKTISSTLTVNTVADGVSQPSYIQTQEAWSNVVSVASASTEPTPNSGWQDYTPAKGNYTYLWRRSRTMTLNESTRQYVAGAWSYQRLSGENGTSIRINGHVATVSNLPTTHSDGDAYVVDADGHLYMWSDEANSWIDVGVFKGDDGITYYTHIAWATGTTDPTQEHPAPSPSQESGQTSIPNKYSVTGFSISPASDGSKPWMGILVDQTVADSTTANLYTWSKTSANTINVRLDNDNDTMLYSSSSNVPVSGNVVAHATLYDGVTPYTTSGVSWSITTSGCVASISGNTVTVTSMSAASGYVEVTGTYNGHTYSTRLTLKKLIDADKYDIVVSPTAIAYNSTTDTPATTSITAECYKTTIDGTRALSIPPSGYTMAIFGKKSDGTNERLAYTTNASGHLPTNTIIASNCDNSIFVEYKAYIGNNDALSEIILDQQTISLNKVEDGDNAVTYKITLAGSVFAANPNTSRMIVNITGKIYKIDGNTTTEFTDWQKNDLTLYFKIGDDEPDIVPASAYTKDGATFSTTRYNGSIWDNEDIFGAILSINNVEVARESIQVEVYGENGQQGQQGQRGKMGRNNYYAGLMSEVGGTEFSVDDYQAPYVNIGTDAAPNCKVFVGSNGTHTFPSTAEGYTNANNWESMTTDFKYLIAQAIFSQFAHLGATIMNGDYMMSQYVVAVGFNETRQAVNNATKYIYVEPDDVFAEDSFDDYLTNPDYFPLHWSSVNQGWLMIDGYSYVEDADTHSDGFMLDWAGCMYTCEIVYWSHETELDLKIAADASGSALYVNRLPKAYHNDTTFFTQTFFITLNNASTTNRKMYFKLHEYGGGTREAVVRSIFIRRVKFTPVNCMDMLLGKIATNNLIARGKLYAESLYSEELVINQEDDVKVVNHESVVILNPNSVGSTVILPEAKAETVGRTIEIFCYQLQYVSTSESLSQTPEWYLSTVGMTYTTPSVSKIISPLAGYGVAFGIQPWPSGSIWYTAAKTADLGFVTYVKLVCGIYNGNYYWFVVKAEETRIAKITLLGSQNPSKRAVVTNYFDGIR